MHGAPSLVCALKQSKQAFHKLYLHFSCIIIQTNAKVTKNHVGKFTSGIPFIFLHNYGFGVLYSQSDTNFLQYVLVDVRCSLSRGGKSNEFLLTFLHNKKQCNVYSYCSINGVKIEWVKVWANSIHFAIYAMNKLLKP